MAFVSKELVVNADPRAVWDAVKDVGAVHTRLGVGFVLNTELDGDVRQVTFANGMVARELIVDVDDASRRLVYSVIGGRLTHDNATMQVFEHGGGGSRVVWQRDLLPKELAVSISAMMDQGVAAMKRTLDA